MKLHAVDYGDGREGLSFRCEGCGGYHTVIVKGPGAWAWNSGRHRAACAVAVLPGDPQGETRCHSLVGCDGAQPSEIVFFSVRTHHLAGQVRLLPE